MLCLYLGFCLMWGVSCSTSSTSTNDLSQPSILSNDSSLPSSVAARLTCNSDADTCSELGHRYGIYSLRHTVTWIIPSLMDIMRVEISARGTTRRTGFYLYSMVPRADVFCGVDTPQICHQTEMLGLQHNCPS